MKRFYIAKVKFKFIGHDKPEITQASWEKAVDETDGLDWYEETSTGQADFQHDPKNFKFKFHAVASPHPQKGYPRLWATLNKSYSVVGIDMDKVTHERLTLLYELAKNLDALLLENGRKIVDATYIEKYRPKPKVK